MQLTHGERRSINGGLTMEGHVQPMHIPLEKYLLGILSRMNGEDRNTYSIWKLPQAGGDPRKMGETFLQAAGSAQAMAIEARVMTNDGTSHLFAIGRNEPVEGPPTTIQVNDRAGVTVSSNELFTAEEAAVIFLTFYLTDTVSQPYQLREINLSKG